MTTIKSYRVPGLEKETFDVSHIERDVERARKMGLPSTGYYGCQWNCVIEGGLVGYETPERAEKLLGSRVKHMINNEMETLQHDMNWRIEEVDDFIGTEYEHSIFRKMKRSYEKFAALEGSAEKLKSKGLSAFVVE